MRPSGVCSRPKSQWPISWARTRPSARPTATSRADGGQVARPAVRTAIWRLHRRRDRRQRQFNQPARAIRRDEDHAAEGVPARRRAGRYRGRPARLLAHHDQHARRPGSRGSGVDRAQSKVMPAGAQIRDASRSASSSAARLVRPSSIQTSGSEASHAGSAASGAVAAPAVPRHGRARAQASAPPGRRTNVRDDMLPFLRAGHLAARGKGREDRTYIVRRESSGR